MGNNFSTLISLNTITINLSNFNSLALRLYIHTRHVSLDIHHHLDYTRTTRRAMFSDVSSKLPPPTPSNLLNSTSIMSVPPSPQYDHTH